MNIERYCFALDLKNEVKLINDYIEYHQNVWPEIISSLKDAGIEHLEIYVAGTRLFMIMEVSETFSFEGKEKSDAKNSKVIEWETLMWKYQQAIPAAKPGEKWVLMKKIYQL